MLFRESRFHPWVPAPVQRPPGEGRERDADDREDPEARRYGGHCTTPVPPRVQADERERLQAEHRERGLPDESVQGQVLDQVGGVVRVSYTHLPLPTNR